MTSPTTHKGNIGQAAAALKAMQNGYHVSFPMEGAPYDLILDKDNMLYRVQVKCATSDGEVLVVRLRRFNRQSVDAFVVHDTATDASYWIPVSDITKIDTISLRLKPSKNGQEYTMAGDYEW